MEERLFGKKMLFKEKYEGLPDLLAKKELSELSALASEEDCEHFRKSTQAIKEAAESTESKKIVADIYLSENPTDSVSSHICGNFSRSLINITKE